RRVDVVDLVVAADVLERRDAEREVEPRVGERQLTHVGDDRPEPGYVGMREVGTDELGRAEGDEAGEIRRFGERVADVEDALLAAVAREAPWDLERPLVALGRRLQLARAPFVSALRYGACETRVQEHDAAELVAPDELLQ